MRVQDLIAGRCQDQGREPTQFRTTVGLRGRLSALLQPDHLFQRTPRAWPLPCLTDSCSGPAMR